MAKDLYQNTQKNENTDSGVRRRRKQKRGNRIIGIAALGVLLVACGAPSGRVEETQRAETKEEPDTPPLIVYKADGQVADFFPPDHMAELPQLKQIEGRNNENVYT